MLRGYFIRKNEPIPDGIRRIMAYQLKYASVQAEKMTGHPDRPVHEFRKCMKRIRSLLKLIRDETGYYQYRILNDAFRNISRKLSTLRDLYVLRSLLQEMKHETPPLPDPAVRQSLDRHFRKRYSEAMVNILTNRALPAELKQDIGRLETLPGELNLVQQEFLLMKNGLQRMYRRGRKAFFYAREFPSTENFHSLRKRVKDLWHASLILYHAWPDMMILMNHVLKQTSDELGKEHDLAVLQTYLNENSVPGIGPARLSKLNRQVMTCRFRLQFSILEQAARIYAEPPSVFASRIQKYWEVTRNGPDRLSG
ncbi:MAG: CHAD domain-containing protein [Bacteroidales bacterium]